MMSGHTEANSSSLHAPLPRREFLKGVTYLGALAVLSSLVPGCLKQDTTSDSKETSMTKVGLVRTTDRAEGVRRAISLLGTNPVSGKTVVLKPNFNSADVTPGSTHINTLRALVESLQARLGYPVEPLAPPLELPEQLPVSQYAGNIGLALRGIATPVTVGEGGYLPLDMNLLPRVYHPWRPTARQIYAAVLMTAAVALIFPLFQVTSEAMDVTSNLQVKFNVLNTRLELMKAEIKKREPLQKAIDDYYRLVDAGVSFTGDVELIRNEAERLGVRVASIAHVGDSIDISCEADEGDYTTFRAYKTALEESGRFSTPVVPPEGYPYTWRGTIKVEPVEAKPGG